MSAFSRLNVYTPKARKLRRAEQSRKSSKIHPRQLQTIPCKYLVRILPIRNYHCCFPTQTVEICSFQLLRESFGFCVERDQDFAHLMRPQFTQWMLEVCGIHKRKIYQGT
jgi:hypothetical protein